MKRGLFKTNDEKISPLPYKIFTCSFDESKILKGIMLLYLDGKGFDLDPTYSTGRIWEDLPQPKLKFDIEPQIKGVKKADACNLPLKNESIKNILFDPPFIIRKSQVNTGIISNRFGVFPTSKELWEFYEKAMKEFWRILKVGGILVFKCQDTISSTIQFWSSHRIMDIAESIGYDQLDLFVLGRNPNNVLWGPNIVRQQHARKNHCFFFVFQAILAAIL